MIPLGRIGAAVGDLPRDREIVALLPPRRPQPRGGRVSRESGLRRRLESLRWHRPVERRGRPNSSHLLSHMPLRRAEAR